MNQFIHAMINKISGQLGVAYDDLIKDFRDPSLHAVTDQTGNAVTMDHLVAMLGSNAANPAHGDAVIVLDLCGMGATVRSDRRARVTVPASDREIKHWQEHHYTGICPRVGVKFEDGSEGSLLLANLAPCGLAERTWVLMT